MQDKPLVLTNLTTLILLREHLNITELQAKQIKRILFYYDEDDLREKYIHVDALLRQTYGRQSMDHLQMLAVNFELGTYGVEGIRVEDNLVNEMVHCYGFNQTYYGHVVAEYCNTGETYNTTIIRCYVDQNFKLCSWGDYVEWLETRGKQDKHRTASYYEALNYEGGNAGIEKSLFVDGFIWNEHDNGGPELGMVSFIYGVEQDKNKNYTLFKQIYYNPANVWTIAIPLNRLQEIEDITSDAVYDSNAIEVMQAIHEVCGHETVFGHNDGCEPFKIKE